MSNSSNMLNQHCRCTFPRCSGGNHVAGMVKVSRRMKLTVTALRRP